MSPLRIALLLHRGDSFEHRGYFARGLVHAWRERGHEVVLVRGPAPPVDADVAVLHTDLTRVPEADLAAAARYPVCLNLGARDISKRRVSRQLVNPGDGYDGPVVIKTDLNCGGVPEERVAPGWRRLTRALPWWASGRIPPHRYPIYRSPADVPWPVRHSRRLVMERFLPERDGELFRLRTWLFLGDAERTWVSTSWRPIVKSDKLVRSEEGDPPPAELRAHRAELGLDYGKIDYAMVDGHPVLYDANRTPTAGPAHLADPPSDLARRMARGLESHLERR